MNIIIICYIVAAFMWLVLAILRFKEGQKAGGLIALTASILLVITTILLTMR